MSTFSTQMVSDKSQWDSYILHYPEANFLQSWEWGEFHKALGKKVLRLAVFQSDSLVGIYQAVKEEAKRGSYLAVAGGPLFDWQDDELLAFVLADIRSVAKKEQVVFVRFRPQVVVSSELLQQLQKLSVIRSPMHLTADLTLQLALHNTEDELLSQMRKNTRYEVKKAQKLGITTQISLDHNDIQAFYDIQCDVASRHKFVPFSYTFLHEQFKAFLATNSVALISSYLEDQLLAQAFIIFSNGEAVYHYGVSTEANAKLPGSYACQWRSIQEAKRRGCTRYNFWGIAPEDQPNHRFAGVSLFKRGFGGQEIDYLPAHDIAISPLYTFTQGFERIRKWRRKL